MHTPPTTNPHQRAKIGVVLLNLGTPEAPRTPEVRRYLREFLMDPYVVDIPWPLRAALVYGVILPFRPRRSAEAYRKVWTERGSPLLVHLTDLVRGVSEQAPAHIVVRGAMRYGQPSIERALRSLAQAGVSRVLAIPLFPQFSLAASESARVAFETEMRRCLPGIEYATSSEFYNDEGFIRASVAVAQRELAGREYDHYLFSFHGIPERQLLRLEPEGRYCLSQATCCDRMSEQNLRCYRAQSFETARRLARELKIRPSKMTVTFQSRLGRTPWIRPYTDVVIPELARAGVRRLAVFSPSFVADCLETLEEIEMRAREQFESLGGTELKLIHSLNAEPEWVTALSERISRLTESGLGR